MRGIYEPIGQGGGGPSAAGGTGGPTGTFYVDGTAGDDHHPGTSPAAAWKTIAKVNASTFQPGNAILFAGGQTFSGAIVCSSSGLSSAPITYGSYGTGNATISSGTDNGFNSNGLGGLVVRDLNFTGSITGDSVGIWFNNSGSALSNVSAINCTVSNYGSDGILSENYNDVLLQDCIATNCCLFAEGDQTVGIYVIGGTNVNVITCIAHDNPGTTNVGPSGNGIILDTVTNGLVFDCQAYNNGANAINPAHTGGPSGFVIVKGTNVNVISCVAHNNQVSASSDKIDGNGFLLGDNNTSCNFIDCVSYNNFGAGFVVFNNVATALDSCSLINFTSTDDGGGSGAANNCSIVLSRTGASTSHITNFIISNCVVYQPNSGTDAFRVIAAGANTNFSGTITGNKFIITGAQNFINCDDNPSSLLFQGNSYISAGAFAVSWNGVSYTSLNAWASAVSQELVGSGRVGSIAINSTHIIGGTTGHVLYDNAGTMGEAAEFTITASGSPNVPNGAAYNFNNTAIAFGVPNVSGNNWFFGQGGNQFVTSPANICIGPGSGTSLTSGAGFNFALGSDTLNAETTGTSNIAIGAGALQLQNGGSDNIGIGHGALFSGSTGNANVAIGNRSAGNMTSGIGNVVIGGDYTNTSSTGGTITSASGCIVIGLLADVPSATTNNQMSIGNFIYGTGLSGTGSSISPGWIGIGKKAAFGSEAFGVVGGITVSGDPGGSASSNTFSGTSSTTISTGVGVIHMSTGNPATNSGWLKCYIGTQVAWVPCWTTNAP